MGRRPIMATITAAVVLIAAGCTSLDCSIDNTVALNVAIPDTLGDTLSVSTNAGGRDTTVYNRGYGITSLSLPISHAGDEDKFFLAFTDTTGTTVSDTLTIRKTNEPHFESVDCTPQFWHTIEGIETTHNRLDSVTITNNQVNNDQSAQHISLYLHSSN